MTPEEKRLLDLFMAAQARQDGRPFTESVLVGIKAIRNDAFETAAMVVDGFYDEMEPWIEGDDIRALKHSPESHGESK